jgi:hypothetical protein
MLREHKEVQERHPPVKNHSLARQNGDPGKSEPSCILPPYYAAACKVKGKPFLLPWRLCGAYVALM